MPLAFNLMLKYNLQGILELSRSWKRHNGDIWQHRFYDNCNRMALVRESFPEYLDAYLALPSDTERLDFFRSESIAGNEASRHHP